MGSSTGAKKAAKVAVRYPKSVDPETPAALDPVLVDPAEAKAKGKVKTLPFRDRDSDARDEEPGVSDRK
jgi:hypothetical protein